jgi:hypothetical protein
MKLINAIAFVFGLGIFALVVLLGILAANSPLPLAIVLGIAATALAPAGFEFCRFALSPGGKGNCFFSRGYRGYVIDASSMLLAIGLTVATVVYHHPPASFVLDG